VQRLTTLRRNNVALRRGSQTVSAASEDVVRIVRRHPEQVVTVFANRMNIDATVELDQPGCDLLTGQPVPAGALRLPPRGVVLLNQAGQ